MLNPIRMQGQNRKILLQHIVMPGIYYQKKLPVESLPLYEWGVFQQLTFPKIPYKQMGVSNWISLFQLIFNPWYVNPPKLINIKCKKAKNA